MKLMPFLSRFKIDSDIDLSQLSESSRRHHQNELRIKGSGKAIVRVRLCGSKRQKPADHLLDVRWVVRKRIFVGSLKAFDDESDCVNGVGDEVSSSQVAKRQKISDSGKMFIGDTHDSETQQLANWRWFASKFNPMSFAREFRIPFDFFGYAISQFIGEVVQIKPEPPNSASLAVVTIKRLILPEHTLMGRLSHHRDNEVFQDFDGTDHTCCDELTENRAILFDVPIEDVLVIAKKTQHLLSARQESKISRGLFSTGSYSLRQNKVFHSPTQQGFPVTSTTHCAETYSQNADSCPQRTGKITVSFSPPKSLERCECQVPTENERHLIHRAVDAAKYSHSIHSSAKKENFCPTFWRTQDLLKRLSDLHFFIGDDFIPLTSLVSNKPNWTKQKRIGVKPSGKSGRNKASLQAATSRLKSLNLIHGGTQRSENLCAYCSRTSTFDRRRQCFDTSEVQYESSFRPAGDSTKYPTEKVRNSRLVSSAFLTTRSQEDAMQSNRALRANQRRFLRDVVSIGLNFDGLAGRDYEENLRFDRSRIHAWGVFADKAIKENKMIVEYRGEIIGNSVAEKREKKYNESNIGSDYMFRIDAYTVCDATKQGNVARFINHSCNPNCFTKIISLEGVQRIVVYAKRYIDAGEELCYDYKFPIESDATKRIECHCGAKFCRGYMNWVSHNMLQFAIIYCSTIAHRFFLS